jgi:hypothetical protein
VDDLVSNLSHYRMELSFHDQRLGIHGPADAEQ